MEYPGPVRSFAINCALQHYLALRVSVGTKAKIKTETQVDLPHLATQHCTPTSVLVTINTARLRSHR